MRTYRAVTTCSAAGWVQYGRKMVETFIDFWPDEIGLLLYVEGFEVPPEILASGRVSVRGLPEWQREFVVRHLANLPAHGRRVGGGYNYKFDAVRFSYKTGAVIDAASYPMSDVLIWLDADSLTHAPVPLSFIKSLLPPESEMAWLDRATMYPECGFYMLDLRSSRIQNLVQTWKGLYTSDRVFTMEEWHDSHVLMVLVQRAGLRTASLSGEARTHSHPLINGPLGAYMDHLKGPRKELGKSRPGDLRKQREEDYWRGR